MIGNEIGPYRIIEKVGQGGMGIVYRGLHVKLDQDVAIKVLSPEFSHDIAMRERFINEAKIQAKISHPNVVNILNYVEDDGNLFLVMEFIGGETLENRLMRVGKLDNAVEACVNVLSALDYMHSRGIVHRDIKPGNIMFVEDGSVKVMDFGIAKIAGEQGHTKTGMRLGSLWYMSPEQIQGEEATAASDIYAVGVTLYQMVTGKVPFSGDSEYKIMKAHLEEKAVPPWEVNENTSKNVGLVILKALAKDKKDRFQAAREFAEALRDAAIQDADQPSKRIVQAIGQKLRVPKIPKPAFQLDGRLWLLTLLCLGTLLISFGLYMGLRKEPGNLPPPIPVGVGRISTPASTPSSGSSDPSATSSHDLKGPENRGTSANVGDHGRKKKPYERKKTGRRQNYGKGERNKTGHRKYPPTDEGKKLDSQKGLFTINGQ